MSLIDKIPTLSDAEVVNLLDNARRLHETGDERQQAAAAELLPALEEAAAERKAGPPRLRPGQARRGAAEEGRGLTAPRIERPRALRAIRSFLTSSTLKPRRDRSAAMGAVARGSRARVAVWETEAGDEVASATPGAGDLLKGFGRTVGVTVTTRPLASRMSPVSPECSAIVPLSEDSKRRFRLAVTQNRSPTWRTLVNSA